MLQLSEELNECSEIMYDSFMVKVAKNNVDLRRGIDHIGVTACFVIHDGNGNVLLHKRGPGARVEERFLSVLEDFRAGPHQGNIWQASRASIED